LKGPEDSISCVAGGSQLRAGFTSGRLGSGALRPLQAYRLEDAISCVAGWISKFLLLRLSFMCL
jgi:hypothetical protein